MLAGPGDGFSQFVSQLQKAAEDASQLASEAADQWVNTDWQVEKRPGQILPGIRPKGSDALQPATLAPEENSAEELTMPDVGLAGPSGTLTIVEEKASALATRNAFSTLGM